MGKKTIILLVIFSFAMSISAQKKELSAARQNIKNGAKLEEAEASMRKLLTDSANIGNTHIWLTLFSSIKKQYDQGNEKLYLKQPYDTAKLFVACRKMFEVLEDFDSIDMRPDAKGIVRPKHRVRHASLLASYRSNLYSGGGFFVKKANYKDALSMYKTYIGCASHPLFSSYNYSATDKNLPEAAYWALFCSYKQNDLKSMLEYKSLAEQDSTHHAYVLQYLAEAYRALGDTAKYLSSITEGYDLYPAFPYFFPRITEYYIEHNDFEKARSIVNFAMLLDSTNIYYRFVKSTVLLHMKEYSEAIDICDDIIEEDKGVHDAYLNAGLCYFNQAQECEKDLSSIKKNRKKIQDLYRQSLPYFERYRTLVPENKAKWAFPLYTIYLNLNMGPEFEEMEKILKE